MARGEGRGIAAAVSSCRQSAPHLLQLTRPARPAACGSRAPPWPPLQRERQILHRESRLEYQRFLSQFMMAISCCAIHSPRTGKAAPSLSVYLVVLQSPPLEDLASYLAASYQGLGEAVGNKDCITRARVYLAFLMTPPCFNWCIYSFNPFIK